MTDAMLHPEFETLTPAEVRRAQQRLWEKQWGYVRSASVFYREKFGGSARRVIGLDAIAELPFKEKDELRRSQEEKPSLRPEQIRKATRRRWCLRCCRRRR